MHDFIDGGGGVATAESFFAGHQLIENAAEGKDVRAGIDGLAENLLGRHVAWRADDQSRGRDSGNANLGHAEVSQFHQAFRREHDIGRLDIAMHDSAGVGVGEGVEELLESREFRGWRRRRGGPCAGGGSLHAPAASPDRTCR